LGREELVTQVHRHPLVPIVGCDVLEPVAVVAGGVVDQHRDRPVGGRRFGDHAAQGLDVAQITGQEERDREASGADPLDGRPGGLFVDVAERHLRFLLAERLDDRGTDPGSAARDEHGAVLEARINGPTAHPRPPLGTRTITRSIS